MNACAIAACGGSAAGRTQQQACASLQLTARPYFHAGPTFAGEDVRLEAAVKDNSVHPVSGMSVEFFIDYDDIGSALTGVDGVARHDIELTKNMTGQLRDWSAQLQQSSCVSTDTAGYTNEPTIGVGAPSEGDG
jgi:hypothetical protein